MPKIVFMRSEQRIYYFGDDGRIIDYECRSDFVPGTNDAGQERASLPIGAYTVSAEIGDFGEPYGTFYIETGEGRERDIHGGGSGLAEPFSPRQGWVPTLGCLRMQNEDGEALSRLIISAGNDVPLEVME